VVIERVKRYFRLAERGSSVPTEILAGVSTFFALSYIFVVNPAILAEAGMDRSAVLFATIVVSASATLAMGLWARLPFVLAPGMEMNVYVAFYVVGSLGFSWQQALGAVFWSGVIFLVLTITNIRTGIIAAIPDRMKTGLSLSIGVFLGLIALKFGGLLRYEDVTLIGLGSFLTPQAAALYSSLAIVLILDKLKVRGAVLISIVLTSVLCHLMKIGSDGAAATAVSSSMLSAIGELDFTVIADPKVLNVILVLFLVSFYGSVAKLIGLTLNTNLVENGTLPRMKEALLIGGTATVFGSAIGTSNITTYVESGVGITAGGRTGLSAVVCALLMLACFAISPLLAYVPVVATTGVLLYVALKLCPSWHELRSYPRVDLVVLAAMQIAVVMTFAIDRAMLVGFAAYLIVDLAARRRPNPYLVASTLLLAGGAVLQML